MNKYNGYEVGPIRPPSEADSLLLRVTRNCPWNKCSFCGLYKGKSFSIRPKEHIIEDINLIKRCIDNIKLADEANEGEAQKILSALHDSVEEGSRWAYYASFGWLKAGLKSVFLQDANSMVIKPDDLIEVLEHLRLTFPEIERITTYARSQTIARISDDDLKRISDAGLNRIHIGMESASNQILELVKKGVDKETHIKAGKKVKRAGIELSEYYMPGLGGNEYFRENATETADALNQIDPEFIRIRTLAVPNNVELYKDYESGVFTRTTDVRIIEELLLFIQSLEGINSKLKSDHTLNLILEVDGKLPEDKDKIIAALQWFLNLKDLDKMIFMVGRRTGVMAFMPDLYNVEKRDRVLKIIEVNRITNDNIDEVIWELMKNFI